MTIIRKAVSAVARAAQFVGDVIEQIMRDDCLAEIDAIIEGAHQMLAAGVETHARMVEAERRAARNGAFAVLGWGLLAIAAEAAILGLAL